MRKTLVYLSCLMILVIPFTLTVTGANAKIFVEEEILYLENETLTQQGISSGGSFAFTGKSPKTVSANYHTNYEGGYANDTLICTNGQNHHQWPITYNNPADYKYTFGNKSYEDTCWGGGGSTRYYYNILFEGKSLLWDGDKTLFRQEGYSSWIAGYDYTLTETQVYKCTAESCINCGRAVNLSSNQQDVAVFGKGYKQTPRYTSSATMIQEYQFPSFNFKKCNLKGPTIKAESAYIVSGTYEGTPAINSLGVTVKTATIIDKSGTSVFTVDEESEATTNVASTGTITTVKLSNPPIIIDWADFPG